MRDLNDSGVSIVEFIVAIAVFAIIATTGVVTIVGSYVTNRLGSEEAAAGFIAQEGIEAVRSIKNQGWENILGGTHGLDNSGGTWQFSGTSDSLGKYTRETVIELAQRNAGGDIVASGGDADCSTWKVTSRVNWDFTSGRSNTAEVVTYLSQYDKEILATDWSSPSQESSLDYGGNNNGWRVVGSGDNAYFIRNGGTPDFAIIDVTNTSAPSTLGTLVLPGGPRDLVLSGNYAYIASTNNARELEVIDISNPNSPNLAGVYNAPGTTNAFGVYVLAGTAYLTRDSSTEAELTLIDVSTPTSPSFISSLELGSDANDVYVKGNYAFIAMDSDSQEVIVVDVSNQSSPSIAGSIDLAGSNNGESIGGYGACVIVGRSGNGLTHILDISDPVNPTEISNYTPSDDTRGLVISQSNTHLFLATDRNPAELQIVDIAAEGNMSLVGSLNISGDINGIYYDEAKDRIYTGGDDNTAEFRIFQP